MSIRTLIIISTLAAGFQVSTAAAQVTFRASTTAAPSCAPGTAWFDGACRDDGWTLAQFGDVETAHGSRIQRADSTLELVDSFGADRAQISWVTSVRVDPESAPKDAPSLESISRQLAGEEPESFGSLRSPTGGAPIAVAPRVDRDAVRGGYLVSRTVEISRESEGGEDRVLLIEKRLDTAHPLGPRLVEAQRLTFDPASQVPVCTEGAPCVLAYAAAPWECAEELLAYIAAYAGYIRALIAGNSEQIIEAAYATARAYGAYYDCIVYGP